MRGILALGAVTLAGVVAAAQAQVDVTRLGPQVGDAAPALSLSDAQGRTHTIASAAGSKGTMVVFFRSADW